MSIRFSDDTDFANGWNKKHRSPTFDLMSGRPKKSYSIDELTASIEEKRLRPSKPKARGDMSNAELETFRSARGPWRAQDYFWNANLDDAAQALAAKYVYRKFAADNTGLVHDSLYGPAHPGRLIPRKYLIVIDGKPYDARTLAGEEFVRTRHTLGWNGRPLTNAELTRIQMTAASTRS